MTCSKDTPEDVGVEFRRWPDGDVIALMPGVPWDHHGNCASYMHVGQHGGAQYPGLCGNTVPATPDEYAPLLAELERIGYRVEILPAR